MIQGVTLGRGRTGESEAVIVHQPQRLNQVRHDASRQQLAFEDQVFLFEIVKAVDDKRVHGIVEIVPVVGATADHVGIVVDVRHFPACENRVLRVSVAFPTRLVVGMVNLQRASDLFDGTGHPAQSLVAVRVILAVDFRLDAQRLGLTHLQLECFVVEFKTGACQFKLARLDDAIEFEASVFAQSQFPAIGHNFHILRLTHAKASDALHLQPQVVEAQQGIRGRAARVGVKCKHIVVNDTFARLDVALRARLHFTVARGNVQVHVSRIGQANQQHAGLFFLQSKKVRVFL